MRQRSGSALVGTRPGRQAATVDIGKELVHKRVRRRGDHRYDVALDRGSQPPNHSQRRRADGRYGNEGGSDSSRSQLGGGAGAARAQYRIEYHVMTVRKFVDPDSHAVVEVIVEKGFIGQVANGNSIRSVGETVTWRDNDDDLLFAEDADVGGRACWPRTDGDVDASRFQTFDHRISAREFGEFELYLGVLQTPLAQHRGQQPRGHRLCT